MRLTTGVLAAALLLWGWHNDLLLVALPLAIIIELPRWIPWRWDLSDKDFQRIADASTVGFVLLAIYQFDGSGPSGIYGILLWLPVAMFPLVLTQIYSTRARIDYSALFWSVRAAVARGNISDPGGVDVRLTYVVVCMVSASGGGAHHRLLLPSVAALVVCMLWINRPRRYRIATWAAVTVAALVACFLLQAGTLKLRRIIEPFAMAYLEDRIAARGDPYRAYTAIGHIGKLKLSDRIVLRVTPEAKGQRPTLLHQATYQSFARNMWVSGRSRFGELRSSAEGTTWHIAEEPEQLPSVSIAAYLPRGKGLLAVPGGTRRVSRLPVDGVYRNSLGALKVLRGPEVVNFRAHYTPYAFVEGAPDATDLTVPKELRELFGGLAGRLDLDAARDRASVERVRRFFSDGFSYTLNLKAPRKEATPLAEFLLQSRSGHCEYYATSTVLLLRAAGIPARYATGYSVQEYSELEDRYIVRRRHAHAWALAWVDGRWRDIDTTPAVWSALESADAAWWQSAYDFGSWLAFLFAEWRWEETEEDDKNWMLWMVLPLLVILLWRMARRQRVFRDRVGSAASGSEAIRQGADSAFYAIERQLLAAGHDRRGGESTRAWIHRLAATGAVPGSGDLLRDVLPLHYRYRFHPHGLDADGSRELVARARRWLAEHPANPA
jgi:transglutaminase-like putative cysteine protease